jgi:hypothetical protein
VVGRLWREPIRDQLAANGLPIALFGIALLSLPLVVLGEWGQALFLFELAVLAFTFVVWMAMRSFREMRSGELPEARAYRAGTLRARAAELRDERAEVEARSARLQPLGAALASVGSAEARQTFDRSQRLIEQRREAIDYEQALIDLIRWRNGAEQALVPAWVTGGAQGVLSLADYGARLAQRLRRFGRPDAHELATSVDQALDPMRALAARYAEADLADAVDGLTHRPGTLAPQGASADDPLAARLHAHLDALPKASRDIERQDARLRLELDDAEEAARSHAPARVRS